jgi:hypothetical protein
MNTTYTTLAGIAGICLLIGFTAALSFRQEIGIVLRAKKKSKKAITPLHLNSLDLFPEENAFGKKRHELSVPGKEAVATGKPNVLQHTK